jgi:hypothetical protein
MLPVFCHDHHAAALETCAAAGRTAPRDSRDSFFRFLPRFPEKRFSDHIPGNGRFFRGGKSSPDALRRVTITSCNAAALKRFERSEAVERSERLERINPGGFVLAGIKPVSSP